MPDIFSCWTCKTSLLNRTKAKSSKFPFHCSKKCQDAYEKKCADEMALTQAWSDFMCGEGECPKEFQEQAEKMGLFNHGKVVKAEPIELTREERLAAIRAKRVAKSRKRTSKKKASNPLKDLFKGSKRKCGKCGETGHNARTCKK